MNFLWLIWLLLAIVFAVAEVFTSGFILLWFGVGAAAAALLAWTGLGGLSAQMLVFLLASSLLTVFSRTIFLKYLVRNDGRSSPSLGVASLPGQCGIVVTPSRGTTREGEIKVYGSIWRALPVEDDNRLEIGEEMEIARVDGNTLYVRRPRRDLEWRSPK